MTALYPYVQCCTQVPGTLCTHPVLRLLSTLGPCPALSLPSLAKAPLPLPTRDSVPWQNPCPLTESSGSLGIARATLRSKGLGRSGTEANSEYILFSTYHDRDDIRPAL